MHIVPSPNLIEGSSLFSNFSVEFLDNDFDGSKSHNDHELVRKEMGLDWMLQPKVNVDKIPESVSNCSAEETPAEEVYFWLIL